jgi:predicted nucleic acid-binding protein
MRKPRQHEGSGRERDTGARMNKALEGQSRAASDCWIARTPHHSRAVDEVEAADRAERQLMTPANAYGEALVAFARADRIADARETIGAMGITVAPLSATIAERAAILRATQSSLRLPDAIVLATADFLVGELLTYDEKLERAARHQRRSR